MAKYNKAIIAIIGGIVTILGASYPVVADTLTPGMQAAIATMITAVLVWAVPNKGA